MASTTTFSSSFLNLPSSVRQHIYTHLLAPHPSDDVTVINYTLTWNWLENPSNSTFAGIPQLDLCRCPQKHRTHNTATKDHIYQRYKCYGPGVRFRSVRENLWVPGPAYARSGQINFLRPATGAELRRRPNANVLGTCWMVYKEAVPVLYRGRNLLFLTGPCPRGRYQAYATQMFLARLGPLARASVTTTSLIAQSCEEDCEPRDVGGAYENLTFFVEHRLPSFKTLCLDLWDERLVGAAKKLGGLLRKEGVVICLATNSKDGYVVDCRDVEDFETALGGVEEGVDEREYEEETNPKEALENKIVMRGDKVIDTKEPESNKKRLRKTITGVPRARPVWEEVRDAETDPSHEAKIKKMLERLDARTQPKEVLENRIVTRGNKIIDRKEPRSNISRLGRTTGAVSARPVWDEGQEKEPDRTQETNVKGMLERLDARTELRLRKASIMQSALSKSRGNGKAKIDEGQEEEEGDEEWVDAALSPAATEDGSLVGDAESCWEIV